MASLFIVAIVAVSIPMSNPNSPQLPPQPYAAVDAPSQTYTDRAKCDNDAQTFGQAAITRTLGDAHRKSQTGGITAVCIEVPLNIPHP